MEPVKVAVFVLFCWRKLVYCFNKQHYFSSVRFINLLFLHKCVLVNFYQFSVFILQCKLHILSLFLLNYLPLLRSIWIIIKKKICWFCKKGEKKYTKTKHHVRYEIKWKRKRNRKRELKLNSRRARTEKKSFFVEIFDFIVAFHRFLLFFFLFFSFLFYVLSFRFAILLTMVYCLPKLFCVCK